MLEYGLWNPKKAPDEGDEIDGRFVLCMEPLNIWQDCSK